MSIKRTFDPERLRLWIDVAQFSDLTYHRMRKQLWDELVALPSRSEEGLNYSLSSPIFFSLKSALCSRNQSLTDDKILAFETALVQLSEVLDKILGTSSASRGLERHVPESEGSKAEDL